MANSRPWKHHAGVLGDLPETPTCSEELLSIRNTELWKPARQSSPAPNTLLIFFLLCFCLLQPEKLKVWEHTTSTFCLDGFQGEMLPTQGMLSISSYNCSLHLGDFWILQPSFILSPGLSYEPWPAAQGLGALCKSGTPNYQ